MTFSDIEICAALSLFSFESTLIVSFHFMHIINLSVES